MSAKIIIAEKRLLLSKYLEAEVLALKGQSYAIRDRSLARAPLEKIIEERKNLEKEIARLESGGIQTQHVVISNC